ncbi:MAG: phosphoenolpyruvate synthase [Streptosporangiales bacterium]|nr:phosphoenolpyruvate synthase [Streptosporangiales bacterium]
MTDRFVAPLRDVGRGDLALAGGKGANLGELIKGGFPVPDGFVVTTDAYAAIVERAGLDARIVELVSAGGDDGSAIRAEFETVAVPGGLRAAIANAYAELGGGPVAVRSSATAEDLPGAAFAGQQDTYLNVVGEDAVLHAVRRCWGSLWTDRAIAYRRRRGIDSGGARIAVVVQSMVDAEAAGVMFTANPVTGDRDQIVVDASAGLGEAVVSGLVTPDHYVLDGEGRISEWSPGRREVVITGTAGGGVTHETGTITPDRLLADEVLAELARLGGAVARHFGRPQDIEWAHRAGRVRLLQARPMTAVPPPPVRLNRRQRLQGSVLLEYLPVRPYPIDMTTWVPHGPAGLMGEVAASIGIRGAFENFLIEDDDGVVDRFIPPSPHPTLWLLAAPFRLVRRARRHDPARWTEDPRFADFLRRADEYAARDLAAMPWTRLIQVPREALDLVKPVTVLRIDYLSRTGLAMLRLLVVLKLLRRGELFGDLIVGAPTKTEAANRALEGLAERVRDNPKLQQAFAELEPEKLMDVAKSDPGFHAQLTAFLAEYGHRETVTPVLVTPPTWGEAPEIALGTIKMLAANPPSPAAARRADQALERLLEHRLLRGKRMRARVLRWVRATRAGMAFREDSHFYFTKPLPILRRSVLEIGRRLCDAGVLTQPLEVFHLRLEELEAIADVQHLAEPDARRLREAVRARSARREELSGVPLIDPSLIFPPRDEGAGTLVSGIPASAGTATGPVRVVREPAEFARLNSGDILVCPATNPAWTPLFQRAVAVVVDSGAVGSHAAIVAREYGIPAVMGTAGGTTVLKDGQLVTVDGGAGRVTLAHDDDS